MPIFPGMDADLDVRVSAEVSSPVTAFSTVLVPVDFETWPAAARQLAIAHERAHIKGRDFYVQWLAHFHRNLFWFNPFAWWLASRLSLLSEHVSDDAATEHAEERTTYARLLLSLVQRSGASSPVVPMVKASSVGPRIERILRESQPARIHRVKPILLACALLPIISAVAAVQTANDIVLPRSDPGKPLSIPSYPPASRRVGEHGTVVLKLHVLEDGSVADAVIDRSSGYPDLDYAAMYESFRWRLAPGTIDGAPSRMWGRFAVTFKLNKDELASTQP
jgi:TonB family protein